MNEKFTLESLNEYTLKTLIDIILKTAKNLDSSMEHKKILKIIAEDFMGVRDYYMKVINSIKSEE